MTTCDIAAHLEEIYATTVSRETISKITDGIVEEMAVWQNRPLDALIVCCDGLKGLPEAIRGTWPDSTVQTCVVHMVRNSLRKVVYTTNAIESLNAQFRRGVRHRSHFPNEQSALKVLYLIAIRKRPNRQDLTGRINGWKPILSALTIHYGDRIAAASH